MSGYVPQQGDEVIVQLRGHVSNPRDGDGFFVRSQAKSSYVRLLHIVSVEKVEPPKPPLPTTPGSVIHYIDNPDEKYMRQNDGRWACVDGIVRDQALIPSVYVIEYDAGAES